MPAAIENLEALDEIGKAIGEKGVGDRIVEPQLYMWSGTKRQILQRHDFYVDQVRQKVFSQFRDIEAQAEAHADSEFDRLQSLPVNSDDCDMSIIAEMANDRGQELYGLLSDLKKQLVLGALAGVYHQWEKDLRDFIERELAHNYKREDLRGIVWHQDINTVFKVLKEFGWNIEITEWFTDLEAFRLIVNVYKHGKGRSLDGLAKQFPHYLKNILDEFGGIWATANRDLDYDWLEVSEEQFEKLSKSLRKFWVDFPERLFLQQNSSTGS